MELQINGKAAIVTGGSRGIGKSIARELATEGVTVAICGRDATSIEESASELRRETGGKLIPLVCDTTDAGSVKAMVTEANRQMGKIEILVNNAAAVGGLVGGLEGAKEEDLLLDINTKVFGYFRCAQEVAPYLKKAGWGRIINIAGTAARNAGTISGMRNLALVHFTKTLSMELGPYGINVNAIHPGETITERSLPMYEEQARKEGGSVKEIMENIGGRLAIGRIVDSTEIAHITAFLCSPKSVAITGEAITANGGVGNSVFQ